MPLKVDRVGKLKVSEADIEKTCTDLLELDGWRSFKMEQNFSERKVKVTGEKGMPDHLYIRSGLTYWLIEHAGLDTNDITTYAVLAGSQVMWIEYKSAKGLLATHQRLWHETERRRGALVLVAGVDFPASIEGFQSWYRSSGLNRGRI